MGIEPFEADKRAFAARTGIAQPYVIYSGRREEGKGTPILVDFLDAFRRRTGRDVRLVMTGSGPVDVPPTLAPACVRVQSAVVGDAACQVTIERAGTVLARGEGTDLTLEVMMGGKDVQAVRDVIQAYLSVNAMASKFFEIPEAEKQNQPEQPEDAEVDEKPKN